MLQEWRRSLPERKLRPRRSWPKQRLLRMSAACNRSQAQVHTLQCNVHLQRRNRAWHKTVSLHSRHN